MNRRSFWPIVGVLVLVAAGLSAWRITSATARGQTAPTHAELLALKNELRELKHAMQESRHRSSVELPPNGMRFAPSTEEAPPAEFSHEVSDEPSIASPEEFAEVMEARIEESARKAGARRARMDSALQAEPRDSRWANEATKTIKEWVVDPALAGSTLSEVECRTSMCRARISLPEGKRIEDFVLATMGKMGTFQTTALHTIDPDAKQREVIAYLGREGMPLPP